MDADCDENAEKLFIDDTSVAGDFNPIDRHDPEGSSNRTSEACFGSLPRLPAKNKNKIKNNSQ